VIAMLFFKNNKKQVAIILLAGIAIDVDHFFAEPIFDADRCSIGFHPLHSYVAIGCYMLLLFLKKTRIIGLALIIHILADISDCLLLRF
jgi:hypothetical protein